LARIAPLSRSLATRKPALLGLLADFPLGADLLVAPHCRAGARLKRTRSVRTILGSIMASSKKDLQLHDVQ
jgi:hypothetical protein